MMKQIKNRVRQLGVRHAAGAAGHAGAGCRARIPDPRREHGRNQIIYARTGRNGGLRTAWPRRLPGLRPGTRSSRRTATTVRTAQSLCAHLQEGKPVVLTVLRGEQEAKFLVSPEKTEDGCRLGLTLRDHIAGIGTVTYYDPDSRRFGALGHGVSSAGDLRLTPAASGFVVSSRVVEVRRGSRGTPGMLKGDFDLSCALGSVTANNECGVFGVMQSLPRKAAVPVAEAGEARAWCCGDFVERQRHGDPGIYRGDPEALSGRRGNKGGICSLKVASRTPPCWKRPAASCRACPEARSCRTGS